MSDAIIRTENLTKTYGSGQVTTHALRGVSLEIPRGAFCAIVGPSGHGKSTLMHLVGGLDRPSAGQVAVDGIELTGLANSDLARLRAEKIGFVFQFFNLLGSLTAEENVAAAMMFAGIPEKRQKERARELLELVGLGEKLGARPRQLSGASSSAWPLPVPWPTTPTFSSWTSPRATWIRPQRPRCWRPWLSSTVRGRRW